MRYYQYENFCKAVMSKLTAVEKCEILLAQKFCKCNDVNGTAAKNIPNTIAMKILQIQ